MLKFIEETDGETLDLLRDNFLARGRIGFVFQELHLIKRISARSNAETAGRFLGGANYNENIKKLSSEFLLEVIDQQPIPYPWAGAASCSNKSTQHKS